MKKKIIIGIALCLGLTSLSNAQFNRDRNNTRNPTNRDTPTVTPADPADEEIPAGEKNQDPAREQTPTEKKTVIRFMTPWTNTSAIMVSNDGSIDSMKTVKNYCGWFEAKVVLPSEGSGVLFRQTIGSTIYGANGKDSNIPISLDSIKAVTDTIWIKPVPYPNGRPTLYSSFPTGSLGVCIKKIPVMMFDWLHGTNGDGTYSGDPNQKNDKKCSSNSRDSTKTKFCNGAKDLNPDFGGSLTTPNPLYSTSNDFGSGGCEKSGGMLGMVEPVLGANGLPVRATNFPADCQVTDHLNSWFVPQVVATDAAGKQYTNATCRDLELNMTDEGMWLGQKDKNSKERGLFFLDDFKFLDEAQTIKNPFYDNTSGHNFGFTMKIQATFEYVPGQYFEFLGDDDVWVFINNRLVVDIGGQHAQVEGAVDLDTIGQNDPTQKLIPGQTYPFHIFYAERHTSESNFKMLTSIDLKTETSLLLVDQSDKNSGIIKYEINQKISEQQLSCDFTSSMQSMDTARAPSNYVLTGGNLPAEGVALDTAGVWYGGITINGDLAGFVVDTAAIKSARALSPGQYCLKFNLQADPTQGDEIWFEVGEYALPTVVFDDSLWNIIGGTVNGIERPIGEWSYQIYRVNVQYEEDWAQTEQGDDILYMNTSNPFLVTVDSLGNPISSVALVNGKATFFILGKDSVVNATLMVKGAASANIATWTNINLKVPPVPLVEYAIMYDRNGDGHSDSLFVKFTKELIGKSKIYSISFTFGETYPTLTKYDLYGDSALIITSDEGFTRSVFTGDNDSLYKGVFNTWFTFSDNGGKAYFPITGEIIDRVNPIITSAEVEITDHNTNLVITFSEGIADSSTNYYLDMFQYKCWRSGTLNKPINPTSVKASKPNVWKLPFNGGLNDVVPAVGDSIRLTEGDAPLYLTGTTVAYDLSGTSPHKLNPWVRITGDQEVQITSAPITTLSNENEKAVEIMSSKDVTVPKLVEDMTLDAKKVAEIYGVQGHLVGFDMAQLAANINAEVVADMEKNNLTIDVIRMIESGQISISKARKTYGFSKTTADAIEEGQLSSLNYMAIKSGTAQLVSKDNIKLKYKTSYFTSLGHYVNGETNEIACSDSIYNGDCLNNGGNLFIAWNMQAKDKRLVGTGVYIARIEIKVTAGKKVITEMTRDLLWGVRRGQINVLELNIKQ